jgi:alpha-1,2-mannosyltransferase
MAPALLGAWALIGFSGLSTYPKLLADAASAYQDKSYSTISFLHAFGLEGRFATAAAATVAIAALAAIVLVARRPNGDVAAFTVAIAAALLASPIVWVHYLLLLYVPIAIVRPRLSGLWLLPLVLWPLGGQESHGSPLRLLFVAAAVAIWAVAVTKTPVKRRDGESPLTGAPAPSL